MDGNSEDWSSLIPAVTDPEGNSKCGTGTDIKYIYTAIDNNYAYIMVETYNKPIHPTAVIEIDFSIASGALNTNISNNEVTAWKPYPDTHPINEEIIVRESVIEIKIPLIELENTTYFNPTFVNIWDLDLYIFGGCGPISIGCQ